MTTTVRVHVLANYLKSKLENDQYLKNVIVQGEISNFTNHKSGHWYFSIKDEQARLNCVMFATYAAKSSFIPKDGDKVLIRCNVSLFGPSGQLQLYVNAIKLDGIGDLYLKFEQLKKQLAAQGLFEQEHKKALKKYPQRLCIITGNKTAALKDVLTTIEKRWPICEIYLKYVLVQGDEAAFQIIDALKECDKLGFDAILLVRGGGSIEDLWAFNNEELANTIYQMKTCVISGVGHETDVTICDYVADVRGATPTAAATLATPDINEVMANISAIRSRLKADMQKYYHNKSLLWDFYWQRLLQNKNIAQKHKQHLQNYKQLLIVKINEINGQNYRHLLADKHALYHMVTTYPQQFKHHLDHNKQLMNDQLTYRIRQLRSDILHDLQLLDAYSPLKIMQRGYNLAYKDDVLIKSIQQVDVADQLNIKMSDGLILAQVEKVKKYDK